MSRSGSLTKVHLAGVVLFLLSALRTAPAETPLLRRGDADASGSINVTDAVRILRFLFAGGPDASLPCLDAADVDDNGEVNISDGVFLLQYLFLAGRQPRQPVEICGVDPTPDDLDCESFPVCVSELTHLVIEANAVVFIIDRSGSMMDSGELAIAKRHTISILCALRSEVEFGVVFFALNVSRFPSTGSLVRNTSANGATAINYIQSVQGVAGTCPEPALLAALDMLRLASGVPRAILFFSDGGATCSGVEEAAYMRDTLAAVAATNTGGVTIHTVGILGLTALNEQFLRDLAEQNGGTFSHITR